MRRIDSIWFVTVFFLATALFSSSANATSQWARKTGMNCNACHTVFPRLNSFGDEYLRNGYQLTSPREAGTSDMPQVGGIQLEKVENLLGFRLNMTPIMWETNTFQKDSGAAKEGRLTLGNPVWIQFFVAGNIYDDISFFSELEHSAGSFKFNWFYFNFTNLGGTSLANFQVGNVSPLEFASYPDRLPQFPNIKGEVFQLKSSNGAGENSTNIRSAHPGIQYFGIYESFLFYAGASPGVSGTAKTQFNEFWGGAVWKMPSGMLDGFEGSNATLHYQTGTDTKNTGQETGTGTVVQKSQVTNAWTRLSPQINIRYIEKLDIQAGYIIAEDNNWSLVANPAKSFKFTGLAFDAGYLLSNSWHVGAHYDNYSSEDKVVATGKPVLNFQRVVPVVTYILNENMRYSIYYEADLTDVPSTVKTVDRLYMNLRMMF
ncbi:MAG: hypothetical protein Q8L88_16125 [Bacteroidota bacterium]|nr:hypothetical protein [Bacteroidota bacterium]